MKRWSFLLTVSLTLSFAVTLGGAPLGAVQGPRAPSPPVERLPIVDRAIAFHGGEAYRSSETELDLCSNSGCFHVKVRTKGDLFDHEVVDNTRPGELTVRTTNTTVRRWQNGETSPVDPSEEQSLRDWVMARVYFPFLPYRLNDPSVYKQDQGMETWGDRSLHRIKVTFGTDSSTNHDDQYLYWIDPDSGRVEQFAYSFKGNPGGLRFRRGMNYRRVGGILFFDQENLGLNAPGLKVDEITPEFVRQRMKLVSTVRLAEIQVRPLTD